MVNQVGEGFIPPSFFRLSPLPEFQLGGDRYIQGGMNSAPTKRAHPVGEDFKSSLLISSNGVPGADAAAQP